MKGFTYFLLGILALSGLVYISPPLRQRALIILTASKCNTPVTYRLNNLDPRFGLTTDQVNSDLKAAAGLWNTAYGHSVFQDSPQGYLTINFVYDERAALDSQINQQKSQLNNQNQTLQQQYAAYQKDVAAFEKKLADYNARIDQINRSGGLTQDGYQRLLQEQQALNAEGDSLRARANEFNQQARDFNFFVQKVNQDVTQFNNTLNQKPEEGLYNSKDDSIIIYFANNRSELVHTIAHEFGHALGMGHATDSASIMSAFSTDSTQLSSQDISQLNYVCRPQWRPVLWLNSFLKFVYQHN